MSKILVTTTERLEGKKIVKYIGPVVSSGVSGSLTIGKTALTKAQINALNSLTQLGEKAGANAIIGMHMNFTHDKGVMLVMAAGTAVVYEDL